MPVLYDKTIILTLEQKLVETGMVWAIRPPILTLTLH
jgi:hypothetical protein